MIRDPEGSADTNDKLAPVPNIERLESGALEIASPRTDDSSSEEHTGSEDEEADIIVPAGSSDQQDTERHATQHTDNTPNSPTPSSANDIPPVPAPRRSVRQRQPPMWMRSGEFHTDGLSARVHLLCGLLNKEGIDRTKITDTIIEIVLKDQ